MHTVHLLLYYIVVTPKQARLYIEADGDNSPNRRPCPHMRHEILFDELKASACRCKKEKFCGLQNTPAGALPQPRWGSSAGKGTPPSALVTRRLQCLNFFFWGGGIALKFVSLVPRLVVGTIQSTP